MAVDIYYYSRTGNCQYLANQLVDKTEAETYRIREETEEFNGLLGWFKGGYYAFLEKEVDITYSNGQNNNLVLLSPVWAGKLPPTVRRFVNEFDFEDKQVVLIATMGGNEGHFFDVLEDMLTDAVIKAEYTIKDKKLEDCDELLEEVCSQI